MPGNLRGWKTIDWGCGVGALVASLQHRGADAVGYDSDSEAIAVGRERWAANIHMSTSFDLSRFHNQFDLLLLSHVVEHLPDIRETMRNLLKVLRPPGYVFIEVPNSSADIFVTEMDPESHLHFFSKRSLTLLLESLGVQVLACVSCGPSRQLTIHQKQTSAIPNLAQRSVVRMKALLQQMGNRLGIRARHVGTIYDGFYEHYQLDESGLWLRCLGHI
jgi:2-polyprenyl-3-methyl-5-hydroxy-6-metoxy-1,4-benzoquinol methylase